jgi:hypothetical protein
MTGLVGRASGSGGQAELFGVAASCHPRFDRLVVRARFARPGYSVRYVRPVLRQLKLAGDFEGVVSFGLGLRGKHGFRVFRLSRPSRVVVDVAHPR